MKITTKKQMYALLRGGRFGNTLRTWCTLGEMLDDGAPARIGLRYSGGTPGQYCAYDMTLKEAISTFTKWVTEGAEASRILWCEAAPDQEIILQGEICSSETHGYALHYSTFKSQMRDALRTAPKNHLGPGALLIIKAVMDPATYEDVLSILEDFPGAVIEFSSYRVNLGAIPGRNTVIWEVRSY